MTNRPLAERRAFARMALAAGLAAAGLAGTAPALAQAQDFPSRPIRWIVPYLAGTSPDLTVRIVAEAMTDLLKQPIVVDNKPGAAGNLGAQIAARAPADGHTWVYAATPMATSMRMYRKPGYDVMKDFIHVGRIGISDISVVTSPESGIRSLKDLIEKARAQPGKLSYASGGVGSPAHMGAELMLGAAGVQALHVPYKGASESANAVVGRQVDFALTITSVSLPHVQAGKLASLAVTGGTRNPHTPQVPTLAEAGVPVKLLSIGGLSVPAGTPEPIVRRIGEALTKALARPEVKNRLDALGGQAAPSTPEEFTEMLRAEIALTDRMMKAAKLEPQ